MIYLATRMANPTADWEKVGDKFYRKIQLYTAVFDQDLELENYIVTGCSYGGAIGMLFISAPRNVLGSFWDDIAVAARLVGVEEEPFMFEVRQATKNDSRLAQNFPSGFCCETRVPEHSRTSKGSEGVPASWGQGPLLGYHVTSYS